MEGSLEVQDKGTKADKNCVLREADEPSDRAKALPQPKDE